MVEGMTTMNATIIAKNLSKEYGELRAVEDVSFTVAQGECVGLLGLNGAGKTTLLRMLSCLLTPTSGNVTVDGADVADDSQAVRRRIGFLPEVPPLYGEMTVERFLAFAARLRGVPKGLVAGRVAETAKRCQVEHVLGQPIETLSYGYKKRVGIAQAVVHNPPLVILDEPIAGLDPAQIVEMRELIRALRGAHTVLLSSHILGEISQTCDRILVMHQAKIVAQGSEAELSASVGQGQGLVLQVRGERALAEQTLAKVAGVERVAVSGASDGVVHLRVTARGDVRAEVSRAVVGAGLGLLSLTRSLQGLEAVFLELTGTREGKS
jgi:ABC-2 type transport system ATP-binding protein